MKIACIGDSLTYGYGVDKGEGWVDILSRKTNMHIVNKGVPGNTTKDMLNRFSGDVISEKPSYVLIMGGTNDVLMGHSVKDIFKRIKSMGDKAKKRGINPIIIFQPPLDEKAKDKQWFLEMDYSEANRELESYRSLALEYCVSNDMKYIDIYEEFKQLENKDSYYIGDGIHINSRAHKLISRIVLKEIEGLVLNNMFR